jgi:hypothetical protein
MGAARTSNKDILAAIEAQTDAITKLVGAISGSVTPRNDTLDTRLDTHKREMAAINEEPGVVVDDTGKPAQVKIPASYLEHQKVKAQEHANNKGERVILYGRVNLAGEQKLAYCLASRWTSLRDNGLIGAIDSFDPK